MSARAVDRRVAKGEWLRICQGIYRVPAFPERLEQTLIAGCLWGGDESCASHRSAAALWRLDGVGLDIAEITVTAHRRSPLPGLTVHRSSDWLKCDRSLIGAIPVTDVTRTLVDLGSVLPEDRLELALDCALRRRMTSVARLKWRIDQAGTVGRKGAARLDKLIRARPATTSESPLEVRFARILRSSTLPPPVPQYEVVSEGEVVARVDFAYPWARLAIEIDGYEFHHGRGRWQRDLERRSRLAALGWRVMHFTVDDLKDAKAVIAAVAAALWPTLSL